MRTLLVLAALGGLLAGCGSDDETAQVSTEPAAPGAPVDAWEQLPESPLSPRATSVAVAIGGEVIVVGGSTSACPPGADCEAPTEPALSDGAAVDLGTGVWRSISPAPLPLDSATTAVVEGRAYFWTFDDQGAARFLRFDPAVDAWDELPTPDPERSLGNVDLVPAGGRLVLPQSDDHVGVADLLFDPDTDTWSELPVDPLTPADHRMMVWSEDRLYLFAQEFPAPGEEEPASPVTRAARLDLSSGEWEQLPDSRMQGLGPVLAEGPLIVDPAVFGKLEGDVDPLGWRLDTDTGTWSTLPPAPDDRDSAGALGAESAVYKGTSGVLLDTTTMAWIDMPPLDPSSEPPGGDGFSVYPPEGPSTRRAVVTAGADAFVFGGVRWDGRDDYEGELLGDAWIWRSGRGTPASSTTTDPATTTTVAPGGTVPLSTGATTPSSEPATTTTPDRSAAELSQTGGCADAYFWAATADGTQALTLSVDVRDRPSTEPTELDLPLPDPLTTVTLQRGSDLTQAFCNDVLDQDYELDGEVPVVEGNLHLTVDPLPVEAGDFVTGTATLTGLVDEDGTRIADLEITTDMMGMYPG